MFSRRLLASLPTLSTALLLAAVIIATLHALRWPLVGDATLMHYAVLALRHGLAPYRQLADINLPGAWLSESLGIVLFGHSALAWRLYDSTLLLAAAAAIFALAERTRRIPALFAAAMLAALHLNDGIPQVGQRDLLIAVLLLAACSFLLRPTRTAAHWILSGLLLGLTLIVKPVLLPLALLLPIPIARHRATEHKPWLSLYALWIAATTLPPLLTVAWLARHQALPAFLWTLRTLLPLHAALGTRPLPFLLTHLLAPLTPAFFLWLAGIAWDRPPLTPRRAVLLIAFAAAALGYILQAKAYPYQRYPALALFLLLFALDLHHAFRARPAVRTLAQLSFALTALLLGVPSALASLRYTPATPFQDALTRSLTAIAPPATLSGHVQCLDTFGGCVGVLQSLDILQSTGFLYDCYLFTQPSPARDQYRQRFQQAWAAAPPHIVILTSQDCFAGARGFTRLDAWPALATELAARYTPVEEWRSTTTLLWRHHPETPTAFRLYLLDNSTNTPPSMSIKTENPPPPSINTPLPMSRKPGAP